MNRLSPAKAALEGIRLMRREPKAVAVWVLLWLAALSATALVLAAGQKVVISDRGDACVKSGVSAERRGCHAQCNPKRRRHRSEVVVKADQSPKGDLFASTL